MWDFVMIGLSFALFGSCLGYIAVCEHLRDSQETATAAAPLDEVSR